MVNWDLGVDVVCVRFQVDVGVKKDQDPKGEMWGSWSLRLTRNLVGSFPGNQHSPQSDMGDPCLLKAC